MPFKLTVTLIALIFILFFFSVLFPRKFGEKRTVSVVHVWFIVLLVIFRTNLINCSVSFCGVNI